MILQIFLVALLAQGPERPLPELDTIVDEFSSLVMLTALGMDATSLYNPELSQYTYTETETTATLDSKGNVKKTETNIYQIIRGPEEWRSYRRQITRNGVPLTEKELAKQDREQEERDRAIREIIAKISTSTPGTPPAPAPAPSKPKQPKKDDTKNRKKEPEDEDIKDVFDFRITGRETIEGKSTLRIVLTKKPNYKARSHMGKMMQHVTGSLWVTEDEHELVRLEGKVIDPISSGLGLLMKVREGSMMKLERREIGEDLWVPVMSEVTIDLRELLVKGTHERHVTTYSDFKKFSVETVIVTDPK